MPRRLAAALALALLAVQAAACALDLTEARSGRPLARLPLPADGRFALHYTHSVTQRPVESRFAVRDGVLLLTAEAFDAHGPGMSTEAQPGERWETERTDAGPRFVLHTARPLAELVVRLHPVPGFRLVTLAASTDLATWGVGAVRIRPDCAPSSTPATKADP